MNLENRCQGQLLISTFDMTTHVYILTFPQVWVGAIFVFDIFGTLSATII
jgi:hypothetical protein